MSIDIAIENFTAKGIAIDTPRWTLDDYVTRRRLVKEIATAGRPFVGARSPRALLAFVGEIVTASQMLAAQPFTGSVVATNYLRRKLRTDRATHVGRIGIGVARLLAARHLETAPLLMVEGLEFDPHPPVLLERAPASARDQSPDLVGRDAARRWHVIEAKGSTRRPNDKLRQAREQAASVWIQSPPGAPSTPPTSASGCVAYLHASFPRIRAVLSDPVSPDNPASALSVDLPRALGDYYAAFASDLAVEPGFTEVGSEVFRTITLPGGGGEIGLERELFDVVRSGENDAIAEYLPAFLETWSSRWMELEIPDGAVGLDGVLLRGPSMFVPWWSDDEGVVILGPHAWSSE